MGEASLGGVVKKEAPFQKERGFGMFDVIQGFRLLWIPWTFHFWLWLVVFNW